MKSDKQVQPTLNNMLPIRLGGFSTLAEGLDYAARGFTGFNFYSGRGALEHVLTYGALRLAALAVARKNVARHRLARRVRVHQSDLFGGLSGARYDLILTNPPYVSMRAMAELPAEYRHEPRLALAGGRDGLDLVARILAAAPLQLAPGGLLICEVGDVRAAVERRFARLRLGWPRPEVFSFESARTAGARRTPPSRAKGAR